MNNYLCMLATTSHQISHPSIAFYDFDFDLISKAKSSLLSLKKTQQQKEKPPTAPHKIERNVKKKQWKIFKILYWRNNNKPNEEHIVTTNLPYNQNCFNKKKNANKYANVFNSPKQNIILSITHRKTRKTHKKSKE